MPIPKVERFLRVILNILMSNIAFCDQETEKGDILIPVAKVAKLTRTINIVVTIF